MKNYRGFYKVAEDGFSLTEAVFFNPNTLESFSRIVWDIDRDYLLDTELNDILWFEDEWIFETLGIRTESEIREEIESVQEEMNELMENFLEEAEELESDEKDALWTNDYAFNWESLEERIKELKEELNNI